MPHNDLIRTQERYYTAHHTLIRIARDSVDRAKRKEPGWADDQFVAVSFCAFAIEAIANAVGEVVFDEWAKYETEPPISKVTVLCETLGIDFDKSVDPWCTLVWLSRFRNDIAHPKPERLFVQKSMARKEYEKERIPDPPQSKLEKRCTYGHAKRSLNAVDRLLEILGEKLTDGQRFGITGDMWTGSTKSIDP